MKNIFKEKKERNLEATQKMHDSTWASGVQTECQLATGANCYPMLLTAWDAHIFVSPVELTFKWDT